MCLRAAACCGGICVLKYCGGCPIPFQCQYMMPCCGKCYTDCDDEGYWTPNEDTLDGECGVGYVRTVEEGDELGSGAVDMIR